MRAVVTGGGTGIGRAVARELAADHEVVVLGRRPEPLAETVRLVAEDGGRASAVVADLTDPALDLSDLGDVDVLVNNAGYGGPASRLRDGDAGPWADVLAINVVGTARACAALVPGMVARGRGRVIMMGSLQASRPFPGFAPYGASKAALMRLTEALAGELDGTGVRVFEISPGLVATDMTRTGDLAGLLADVPAGEWTPVEKVTALCRALVSGRYDALHGRFVHAEDDLDAVLAALDPDDPDARRLRLAGLRPTDPLLDD